MLVAQYPLHYVTYAPVKFEVAMSIGLGRDAFTRKYILTFGLDLWTKCCSVPSLSCDLFTCKVLSF